MGGNSKGASVSLRILRNFHLIFLPELDPKTLELMVSKVFEWGFKDHIDKVKHESSHLI
jgi:hypothetical protein